MFITFSVIEENMKLICFFLILTPFLKKLQRITLNSVQTTASQLHDALVSLLFLLPKNSCYFLDEKRK